MTWPMPRSAHSLAISTTLNDATHICRHTYWSTTRDVNHIENTDSSYSSLAGTVSYKLHVWFSSIQNQIRILKREKTVSSEKNEFIIIPIRCSWCKARRRGHDAQHIVRTESIELTCDGCHIGACFVAFELILHHHRLQAWLRMGTSIIINRSMQNTNISA